MADAVVILVIVLILIFALNGAKKRVKGGCCSGGSKVKRVKAKDTDITHYSYKMVAGVEGMTCDSCKIRVENAFNSLPGCYAKVNLKNKCAEVWSKKEMSEEEVSGIVKKSGYKFVSCIQE